MRKLDFKGVFFKIYTIAFSQYCFFRVNIILKLKQGLENTVIAGLQEGGSYFEEESHARTLAW